MKSLRSTSIPSIPTLTMNRRRFLRGAGAVALTTALPASLNTANAGNFSALIDKGLNDRHIPNPLNPHEYQPFMHGVASGDPLPNSVILWTRVTPSIEAVPGSGVGSNVSVLWQIATDVDFQDIVRQGSTVASVDHDHTVHVDPWGLTANTEYFYRFIIETGEHAGYESPIGRTKTAPAATAAVSELNFAVSSCANFESGYFSAYSDMARRAAVGDIDVVVHLGDYIYEYASGEYAGKFGVVRSHEPTWEILTLSDYRVRYGRYRRDSELQAAHQAAPWVVMWDDHEIANNSWANGAEHHDAWKGSWDARRNAAMQAYMEWLPVRGQSPSEGGHIYRSLKFGNLAELTMLDLRTYRDEPEVFNVARAQLTDRTMLGSEQFSWLNAKLASPEARWNIVGTSVMLAPVSLVNVNDVVAQSVSHLIGGGSDGIPYNLDQWDGYAADRSRLLKQLRDRQAVHPNVSTVFLAGDIHSEWASTIYYENAVVGCELVCTSVSAPNIDDTLKLPVGNGVSVQAATHLKASNPHIKHVELDNHGYSLVKITPSQVTMQWMRVDEVHVAGSPIRPAGMAAFDGQSLSYN